MEVGLIQRAYELAASGEYPSVTILKRRLRKEGFLQVENYLQGRGIHNALLQLCRENRAHDAAHALSGGGGHELTERRG